jgi:short-subunit dehydrogenase
VLVNNAGTFAFLPTADQDIESSEAIFDVNVRGTFFLTAAIAPKMAAWWPSRRPRARAT